MRPDDYPGLMSDGVGYELEVHLRRGAKIVMTKIGSNNMRASGPDDNPEAPLEAEFKK